MKKLLVLAAVCAVPGSISAQDTTNDDLGASIQVALNEAQICAMLPDLDAAEVAEIIGIDLPIPPFVDTGARWDKDRHEVISAFLENDRLAFEVRFGCQPSDDGALIRLLPLSGDNLRLTDNGSCEGPVRRGSVDLDCDISGELGSVFGAVTGLDKTISDAVAPILQN